MSKYIGVKILESAKLMTKADYCEIRGWNVPSDEDPNEEVYLVEYEPNEDNKPNVEGYYGYVSMSPKDVFEKAYRPITGITFGLAIEALKKGKRVQREGWNGKGMFIFGRPADELEVGFIIDKVKSLPESVKGFFKVRDEKEAPSEQGLTKVKFSAYLCMYAADGSIVNGWLASQTDILAEDWIILD